MVATEEFKRRIFEDYHAKVLGYLRGKVNDGVLAEDLCSDVFLKIYEKSDTFDESKASLSTWIFTVMRNRLTDYYRTRRVFEEVPEDLPADSSVEEDVCSRETLDTLAAALERLDVRSRDIIVARYYGHQTLKEIGERMGYSYAYIKTLHNKALDELKKYF